MKHAGQNFFGGKTTHNRSFHGLPNLAQIVPNIWLFTLLDIFPEVHAVFLTVRHDVINGA